MILSMKKMLRKCCLKNAFLSSVHLVDVVVAFHAVALARGQHHVIAVNRTLSLSLSQRKEHLNIFLCKRLCVCVCACSFVLSVSDQMLWKCFTLSECVSYHHIFPFLEGQMRQTHTDTSIRHLRTDEWWCMSFIFQRFTDEFIINARPRLFFSSFVRLLCLNAVLHSYSKVTYPFTAKGTNNQRHTHVLTFIILFMSVKRFGKYMLFFANAFIRLDHHPVRLPFFSSFFFFWSGNVNVSNE